MRHNVLKASALALASLAAPAVNAQSAPPAARSAAATITLPFAPPLGVDLRYRVTTHKMSGGKPVDIEMIQTLRFTRLGDGYVMRIATVRATTNGISIMLDDPHAPLLMRMVGAPVDVDLDAAGTSLRIRDWPAVQKRAADMVTAMLAISPVGSSDRATLEAVGKNAVAHFNAMTAEQATSQWLQNWDPLLGVGGLTMQDGQSLTAPSQTDMGFGTPIPTQMIVTMHSASASTVRLTMNTRTDDAQLGVAIGKLLDQLSTGVVTGPATRTRMEQLTSILKGLRIDDRIDVVLDRDTGVPRTADIRRLATVPNQQSATVTIRVERVD